MPKILSLDTEQEILGLLHVVLKRAGYTHITTTDSQEALRILREKDIDLFTQNIMRADMNGCELYEIMHSDPKLHKIPTLVISSLDPLNLPEPCGQLIAALHPQHYITMPFSPKNLLTTIQNMLE